MVILCMVSLLNALLGSTQRTSSFQFSMKPLFVTGRDICRNDMFCMMVYHYTSEAFDEGMHFDCI